MKLLILLSFYRAILVITGLGSFALAKSVVDKQRYEHMKSRDRMKNSNVGEYEPSTRKF